MSTPIQNNETNPMAQEAYQLIGQLNDNNLSIVVNFIKKLIDENSHQESEHEELQRKRAAFAKLMELREEIAATHPKSLEEERFEAMAEKYPFLRDEVRK